MLWKKTWVLALAAGLAFTLTLTGCGGADGTPDEGSKDADTPLVRVDGAEISFRSTILLDLQEQGYDLSPESDFVDLLEPSDSLAAGAPVPAIYLGKDGQVIARLQCDGSTSGEIPLLEARVTTCTVFYGPHHAEKVPENLRSHVEVDGIDFTGLTLEEVDALLADRDKSTSQNVGFDDFDLLSGGQIAKGYQIGRCAYIFRYHSQTGQLALVEIGA